MIRPILPAGSGSLLLIATFLLSGIFPTVADARPDPNVTGHEMLTFEGLYGQTDSNQKPSNATGSKIRYMRNDTFGLTLPPYAGKRYEDRVPDTLDIAERSSRAIGNMTGLTDPELDYDTYFGGGNVHCFSDICGVKFQEATPLLRLVTGSQENLHVDRAWFTAQLRSIGPDGLLYIHRPYLPDENMFVWCSQIATAEGIKPLKGYPLQQFCETVVQGRILGVFTIYYLRDNDPRWISLINRAIDRIGELAIDKGDFAYLPVRAYEFGAQVPAEAGMPINMGAEELAGRFIQGLAQYYRVTRYEPARELCRKFINYLRFHSHYFDEQGRWTQKSHGEIVVEGGHFHAHALSLLNFLEYGMATGDAELIAYVNKSFNWALANSYSSRLTGWFPELVRATHTWSEPCCPADMIALALKLTQAGAGDYLDDVDRWARNQFAEAQTAGGGYGPGCCTGNATRALYYLWQDILHFKDGKLTINLLLNRASPWADVYSYIPNQGRVDIKVKEPCRTVFVRAPEWIETGSNAIKATLNDTPRPLRWQGRYLLAGAAGASDRFRITFPIAERTITERMASRDYELVVRGNTVVSIDPRGDQQYMPLYQREHLRTPDVKWVQRTRFVSDETLYW